jgi:hypothetical protein
MGICRASFQHDSYKTKRVVETEKLQFNSKDNMKLATNLFERGRKVANLIFYKDHPDDTPSTSEMFLDQTPRPHDAIL